MPRDFDLKLAIAGHPLVTRGSPFCNQHKVLDLLVSKHDVPYPLAVLFEGFGAWESYPNNGRWKHSTAHDHAMDLLLADLPDVVETAYMVPRTPDSTDPNFIGVLWKTPFSSAVPVTITRPGVWAGQEG